MLKPSVVQQIAEIKKFLDRERDTNAKTMALIKSRLIAIYNSEDAIAADNPPIATLRSSLVDIISHGNGGER